jgi:hypothetical protein
VCADCEIRVEITKVVERVGTALARLALPFVRTLLFHHSEDTTMARQSDQSLIRAWNNHRAPIRRRNWIVLFVIAILSTGLASAQANDLGIFTNQGSVGQTPPGVTAHYDSPKGEYRITGGGANVWAAVDAFYFVWKKASDDMTLTADVQWVGTSSAEHRKAVLMIRQSLDPGSAYADAVSHGNGLTSLQFRGAANEQTYQVVARWKERCDCASKGKGAGSPCMRENPTKN